jgi:hypothetical protein
MPPPSGGPVDHSARQHRAPQVLDGLDGNVTINSFEFSGAKVADGNGAGIRHETGNLTLNNDGFSNILLESLV